MDISEYHSRSPNVEDTFSNGTQCHFDRRAALNKKCVRGRLGRRYDRVEYMHQYIDRHPYPNTVRNVRINKLG